MVCHRKRAWCHRKGRAWRSLLYGYKRAWCHRKGRAWRSLLYGYKRTWWHVIRKRSSHESAENVNCLSMLTRQPNGSKKIVLQGSQHAPERGYCSSDTVMWYSPCGPLRAWAWPIPWGPSLCSEEVPLIRSLLELVVCWLQYPSGGGLRNDSWSYISVLLMLEEMLLYPDNQVYVVIS